MKSTIIILLVSLFSGITTMAQNANADKEAYVKTITERANKIVAVLNIEKDSKKEKVSNIIRDQYSNLNDIYTARDIQLKQIKETIKVKAERDTAIAKENANVDAQLAKLHKNYLHQLNKQLTATQVEQVKDGMTYGVLPLTYKAYQEQILTLTTEQKSQILAWLTEAREHAMDAESSEKKHAWFGKYKGRINNYLSAAGYDLKQEGIEWEKRRKAANIK
jgi:hypothetical protein